MPKIDFAKQGGMVPVVVQDHRTKEVLMLAYMNEEAFKKTERTKKAHFYSRSRAKLWLKGEQSGHYQRVKGIFVDCDNDTILLHVDQLGGGACHTGYRSCFFRKKTGRRWTVVGKKAFDPKEVYGK
ncbi:MAG TPA: phosphoribosyl-AMP cyclohydrolase [Candidatus Acidoferrales bacterium]|nr:phosphoribosyl-AMP cyclohydrolase [Candidatus Acidoferrales bacterium]